jgi:hypothetical protein
MSAPLASRCVCVWNRNIFEREDLFLTVAIMSVTFLAEVGLFILIGMI